MNPLVLFQVGEASERAVGAEANYPSPSFGFDENSLGNFLTLLSIFVLLRILISMVCFHPNPKAVSS